MRRFCVDTKFNKLGVETKLARFGVEIKGRIDDANSLGSIKLLMYLSRPAVVDIKLGEEIKLSRF